MNSPVTLADELGLADLAASAAHVASENPEAYIPGDRRRALAAGVAMPDRVRGAALFADISGFTPLTEALANELGPQRGAEELTKHLNRVFHGLIAELDRYGGEVIYFSGDAITCWLDSDDGVRALACALAMQDVMGRMQRVVTPAGANVQLGMKVAVAVGAARRFVVGDPDVQLMDVLAGRLVDALALAEHQAKSGEVVVDKATLVAISNRVEIGERRHDPESGQDYHVVTRLLETVEPVPTPPPHAPLSAEVVKHWLLPSVYERLRARRGEFMAELRPAYPLFVRFAGIDYDHDDDAPAKLDAFVRNVQRSVTSLGGNVVHLALGDKGAYLYAVFGSPVAHEDDAARAAAAALELRELTTVTAARDIQIGITYGRLRSGMYGHAQRQAFTCLGDSVNLAARLMSSAPPGEIYAAEHVRVAAGAAFEWNALAPISVKGKAEPVIAFALVGSKQRAARARGTHEFPMIGRRGELEQLCASSDAAFAGHGQVVGIAAEAGMGKSRLLAELGRVVGERGTLVATGECQAYGTHTSYFVWRDVWTTLFGLDDSIPAEEQIASVEAQLAAIDPALVPRAPLLGVLLELAIPDNELTAQFDAKLRKASLESLLVECLRTRAASTPLLIVLEDCHWIDPLSRDLLEVLARAIADQRVVIAVAYRPARTVGGDLKLEQLPYFSEIALTELDEHFAGELIAAKAQRMLGAEAKVSEALVKLVTTRAQGNPFFIEELLNFIASQGVDLRSETALRDLDLPESLHSLILSRIDGLEEAPRRTLKVASVVGRSFAAPMLPGAYPETGELPEVREQLAVLTEADLVNVDVEAEQTYLFKHAITQQVAYESLPFSLRSLLHERIGTYIERSEPDAIDRQLDLLAHHFWHTENLPKKRDYLRRAGIAAQAAYANTSAIDYFERLAPLVDGDARVEALTKLGSVLDVVGEWRRAEEALNQALAVADKLNDGVLRASVQTALADIARKQGRFDEAVALLNAARAGFEAEGDQSGMGRVQHLVGTVAAQRGDYDTAVKSYEASLSIRERLGDKANMGSLLSNLGIIAEYRGDYAASRAYHERAMALRKETGDRRAIANSAANLGNIALAQKHYAEARQFFERGMLLIREVGDLWMAAVCNNNLGNSSRSLGEYDLARKYYAESLRAHIEFDDRWSLAFLLEDLAMLAAKEGDGSSALELLGASDTVRDGANSPRPPSREEEIDRELSATVEGMPDHERGILRGYGRSLDLPTAAARALKLCEAPGRRAMAMGRSVGNSAVKQAARVASNSRV